MKQIYEIPEVTIFEVGPVEHLLLNSETQQTGYSDTPAVNDGENWGKGNYMDDTPWYRR